MPAATYDAALTNRSYDKDGRLHILKTRISKATVNPYYGREIPEADMLGLDPNRIYYLLRDPDELKKAAPSFARVPLMFKHIAVSAEDPQQDQIAGTIGSDVEFESPYLIADLSVWDVDAIAGIETDTVREISCSYHYSADMTPGVFEGQPYDGVMRNLAGNHVALVPSGRAGSDVLAADSGLESEMKETKFGKLIYAILCAASPKLAKDAALKPLVIGLTGKSFDVGALKPKLLAMDEEIEKKPETLAAMQAAKDASEMDDHQEDDEQEKTAKDCSYCGAKDGAPHADGCTAKDAEKNDEDGQEDDDRHEGNEDVPTAEEREMAADYAKALDSAFSELESKFKREGKTDPGGLAYKIGVEKYGKKGMEEKAKAGKDAEMKMKTAMDSFEKKLRAELKESYEARRAVRSVVGDVLAQDSAEEIYGFALDQMKVDRKGVSGVPALRALFNLASSASKAPATRPAFDGIADMQEKFPNASRELRVL
jgi:uncharacterized protein